jgi:small ligand-binding sensory domain FIST
MTRIAAGLSTSASARTGGVEAAHAARADLGGATPDLAFVFLSQAHLPNAGEAVAAVWEELAPRHLLGCVAQGVLAGDVELEDGPGVAVWAASLPGAGIECFHAHAEVADGEVEIAGFPELGDPSLVALLVDPFTFPAGALLDRLNDERPGLPLVGGVAVGGGQPGAQALVLDTELYEEGAVGAIVSGVPVRVVVSQGCAPIGHDSVITKADGNVIFELAGRPALERLRDEVAALSEEEQSLVRRGLLAGLVIDENKPEYGRGDFLIRGLLGADETTGALAVGERLRVGQTLKFHVRDAGSADVDLREALDEALGLRRAAGALLFTCNGRGRHMFTEPSHDARAVSETLGAQGVAGFFCGGEIGPVGSRVFLHGFTATMAVFLAE